LCIDSRHHRASEFQELLSKLENDLGGQAFVRFRLNSIAIPASTEEIDGSAFVSCPLMTIRVSAGSLHFIVEKNMLLRAVRL
jgi:hypothetical protein